MVSWYSCAHKFYRIIYRVLATVKNSALNAAFPVTSHLMVDSNMMWYAACYTFPTVICLPVNILLKSASRPDNYTSKLSTLVQRCHQNAENGKDPLMQRNKRAYSQTHRKCETTTHLD